MPAIGSDGRGSGNFLGPYREPIYLRHGFSGLAAVSPHEADLTATVSSGGGLIYPSGETTSGGGGGGSTTAESIAATQGASYHPYYRVGGRDVMRRYFGSRSLLSPKGAPRTSFQAQGRGAQSPGSGGGFIERPLYGRHLSGLGVGWFQRVFTHPFSSPHSVFMKSWRVTEGSVAGAAAGFAMGGIPGMAAGALYGFGKGIYGQVEGAPESRTLYQTLLPSAAAGLVAGGAMAMLGGAHGYAAAGIPGLFTPEAASAGSAALMAAPDGAVTPVLPTAQTGLVASLTATPNDLVAAGVAPQSSAEAVAAETVPGFDVLSPSVQDSLTAAAASAPEGEATQAVEAAAAEQGITPAGSSWLDTAGNVVSSVAKSLGPSLLMNALNQGAPQNNPYGSGALMVPQSGNGGGYGGGSGGGGVQTVPTPVPVPMSGKSKTMLYLGAAAAVGGAWYLFHRRKHGGHPHA